MYQQPTQITREGLLLTPGRTVVQGQYIQADSPTLSSSRVRWVQLFEWINFRNDFTQFWRSLPEEEKNEYITDTAFLDQYRQLIRMSLVNPTNEDMLSQHLDMKYSNPHNLTAHPRPTMSHNHAKIIRRDSFYQTFGWPDYLFVEQDGFPRRLYLVMELKTFWKVTQEAIAEVLNGDASFPPGSDINRDGPRDRVPLRKIGCRTDIWIYGLQC